MGNFPTLSVMMANYNYGQYIGESLEAILTQSFSPTEVIVTDDGSTDNSVEIIRGFQKRYPNLRLLQNKKNMGVLYSINRCLSEAKGDYVYPASSDDKVLPGFFEKSMGLLIQYPQAGFSCSDILIINGKKHIEDRSCLGDKPCYFTPNCAVKLFMKGPFAPICYNTVILKRSVLDEAGGYIKELQWSGDSFATNVICFRYGFCYIPEALAMLRVHSDQYGASNASKSNLERKVIINIMDIVRTPPYNDVLPAFKRTAPFSSYPWEVLMVVLSDRKYREYFSFKLLRFALYNRFISRGLRNILPDPLLELLRKIKGYAKRHS